MHSFTNKVSYSFSPKLFGINLSRLFKEVWPIWFYSFGGFRRRPKHHFIPRAIREDSMLVILPP